MTTIPKSLMILCFLSWAMTALAYNTPVRDKDLKVIGYFDQQGDKTFVRDCNMNTIGYSTKEGTFDVRGNRLFKDSLPALLLEKSSCREK